MFLISFAGKMNSFVSIDASTSATPLAMIQNGQNVNLLKMFITANILPKATIHNGNELDRHNANNKPVMAAEPSLIVIGSFINR